MRGRGKILQALSRLSVSGDAAEPPTVDTTATANPERSVTRGRGARLARMVRQTSSSDVSSESSSTPALTRQDSDVSRTSVVSQQFANVEQSALKANLPKTRAATGAPVQLSLNYMTFDTTEGATIMEYHVEFNPSIESIRLRYSLLRSPSVREVIGSVMHWNGTNLYLPVRLRERTVTLESPHPVTNTPVKIKIVYVKTPPKSELLPFYNSLMHKAMNMMNFVIINRQHYSPLHKIAIEQFRLEVWPGWITSIQNLDGGIKLIVDASFRVLRLETVRDIMMEIKSRARTNLKEAFESELIGCIIMTRYNNRAYRIDGVDLTKTPRDTFTLSKDNRSISYSDYMREHWNVEVQDLGQPMLVHQPKPRRGQPDEICETLYLIPELCVTTGLTDDMRANFNIMKAIGDNTRLPPDVRETKLSEFLQQLSTEPRAKSVFEDWNLRVRPSFDIVEGRKLDTEVVLFGNNKAFKVLENVDWTRPATTDVVFQSEDINEWVLMHTERDSDIANDLLTNIQQVSRSLGINFKRPRVVVLPNDSSTTYVSAGKREVKPTDQMVVILTPGKGQREDRYSACKRLYSCELPVPCQFIRCGTIANVRKIRSVCQKVVIQILSKVGGQPWAIKFPMKSFMIIGIDVYHDTIDRNKSCVGFVASMNHFTSKWWSHTFFQNSLEEIGQKLNATIISALRRYHQVNGSIPERIIVYRDGVGDGQLDTVLKVEIVQALNAVKFYMRDGHEQEQEPDFSYIVVQKRINTKISLREHGRVLNPKPGTYLDHTITHPDYNDFYLVSQHVNQGTVSPTKYILLAETGKLKLEHHQKLAYKMTHMYYNWCGTIRVPAPCQYAHKLAYLTGQNIRQQANERLADRLYYL